MKALFFLCVTVFSFKLFSQSNFIDQREITIEEKELLPYVFSGTIVSRNVVANGYGVWTKYSLWVNEVFKGDCLIGDTIIIQAMGGVLNSVGHVYPGELCLDVDTFGKFYLDRIGDDLFTAPFGAQSMEVTPIYDLNLNGVEQSLTISPIEVIGNSGQSLIITGSGFGSTRGSGYATFDSGGGYYSSSTAQNLNYIKWKNDTIIVLMPIAVSNYVQVVTNSGQVLSSNIPLKVVSNINSSPGNLYGRIHHISTNNGGYEFKLQENLIQTPGAQQSVYNLFEKTSCVSSLNFQISTISFNSEPILGDGINGISFDTPISSLPAGIEGRCNYIWNSCINNGETFYYASEVDIVFSRNVNWYFGTGVVPNGYSKFNYVLMHELGHAGMLGHVNEEGETMHPVVSNLPANNWNFRDEYTQADTLGLNISSSSSFNFQFQGCGVSPMQPLVPSNCANIGVLEPMNSIVVRLSCRSIEISGLPLGSLAQLQDGMGRVLKSWKNVGPSLEDELNLVPGIYFLSVVGNGSLEVFKEVIQCEI
jgi:hypothetical protein